MAFRKGITGTQKNSRHRKNTAPYMAGAVTIGIFSVVSIVLFGASWVQSSLLSSNHFAAVISAVLVDLANADRADAGASALTVNSELVQAAQAKADDMAARGYFAHISPDGREPWDFITAAGYTYQYAGENLAIQFSDSDAVEKAWLASPKHRENIMNGHYTEIGIATAQGFYEGQQTTFVVQMFGSPRIASVSKSVVHTALVGGRSIASTPTESAVLGASTAINTAASAAEPHASPIAHLIASPKTFFDDALTLLAALALVFGAYLWIYEMRQRHYRHSIYVILFSIALVAFLYAADALIFTTPVVSNSFATIGV